MTSHTQKWTKRRTSGSFYKEKLIDTGAEKKEERQEASKHKSLLTPERKEKTKQHQLQMDALMNIKTSQCIPLCPQEDIFCGCVLLTHLKIFRHI